MDFVVFLGGIASQSASDAAHCYTLLRSVVCLSSVVCHIRDSCLKRSTDLHAMIWQIHLWGPMTHCVRCGP